MAALTYREMWETYVEPNLKAQERVRDGDKPDDSLETAVANAVAEVKTAVTFVTKRSGGDGAVREVAETILKARGVWNELLQQYLLERGDVEAPRRRSRRAG